MHLGLTECAGLNMSSCLQLPASSLSTILLFPPSLTTFSAVTQSRGAVALETLLAVLNAPCCVTPGCRVTAKSAAGVAVERGVNSVGS